MKVVEIFPSIQGEGAFLGTPVIFIRLAGCNLSCSFCDTDFSKSTVMTMDDIRGHLNKWPKIHRVVLTGGEPTIHPGFETLCKNLHLWGYKINVETNGTQVLTHKYVDWITCSPKEASGYTCNCIADEFKLVVTPDFDPKDVRIRSLLDTTNDIWLQPEGSQMKAMWEKCAMIALQNPRFRVGVQLHKLMEVR